METMTPQPEGKSEMIDNLNLTVTDIAERLDQIGARL